MKIGELDQHCANCSVGEFCGSPWGYCLCRDDRFVAVEDSEYWDIAQAATAKPLDVCNGCNRPDCEPYRYSDVDYADESCEYSDEARDYRCEQIADYAENTLGGGGKDA
ncbi:hypothetical protein ALO_12606 [Acetonema longum DSM 6540]|uniref:Uncharacterized protein n=1 Tax=Acetonema longum DSM 6540 TaxID=1009370 RepID=F7NKA8_9FIRM|nr:hypothetical protein ALO_12606 [Acetonema longum DSM 6540]